MRVKTPKSFGLVFVLLLSLPLIAQTSGSQATFLRPARVFDGESMHDNWLVVVRGDKIEGVGAAANINVPAGARSIELPGMTLLSGLIEAHSHVLLHPYSETSWTDQVVHEPLALRVARATKDGGIFQPCLKKNEQLSRRLHHKVHASRRNA